MFKKKSPLAAIGLATGALALQLQPTFSTVVQPYLPLAQRYWEQVSQYFTSSHTWNYALIMFAVILEGPIATLLGGIWAKMGRVNFWWVLLVAIAAGMMADSFWYYLGYFGREQVLDRWGDRLRFNTTDVDRISHALFGQDGTKVLFTAKLTSALIIPTILTAGIARMGWFRTMKSMIIAQIIWSVGLTVLGFFAADSVLRLTSEVEYLAWILWGGLVALFLGRFAYRWYQSGRS